jgi:hypothetical protein
MADANNNGAKELPSLQDLNNETVDLVIHPENWRFFFPPGAAGMEVHTF